MTVLREFLQHWEVACDRKDLPKLIAEVQVAEAAQSQAARLGREFLFACALGPWEADDVLSEIALLTLTSAGEDTWRMRRLNGPQAAREAGSRLTAYFARSFVLATWVRQPALGRFRRPRTVSLKGD